MIEIRLDGEPIGKGRHRSRLMEVADKTDKKRTVISQYADPVTASFENRLAWAAQAEMKGRPLYSGPLTLHLDYYLTPPKQKPKWWYEAAEAGRERPVKKPDWDNVGKICDALNRVVWFDDAQIVDARVRKFWSERPRIFLRVDNLS